MLINFQKPVSLETAEVLSKPMIYNQFTRPRGIGRERPSGASMTQPDQTFTMREILARYAQGLPPVGTGFYDDGDDPQEFVDDDEFQPLPDLRGLDLSERQSVIDGVKKDLEYLAKKRKVAEYNENNRKKKAAADAAKKSSFKTQSNDNDRGVSNKDGQTSDQSGGSSTD